MSSLKLLNDLPTKDLLNLKLKKPKSWNWELSTSKSSSSINFPRIRLYDHHDNLLAEADESDQLLNNTTHPTTTTRILSSSSTSPRIVKSESFRGEQHEDVKRSHTRSKSRSKTTDISGLLDDIRQEMVGQGFKCKVTERGRSTPIKRVDSGTAVDVVEKSATASPPGTSTPKEEIRIASPQPITVYSERGPLQRDRNAKEFNKPAFGEIKAKQLHLHSTTGDMKSSQREVPKSVALPLDSTISQTNYSMAKSKSAIEVTGKKKVYRRTHSTNSPSRFSSSILERFSVTKRRSSSTDSEAANPGGGLTGMVDQQIDYQPPSYVARTCPAGTLIVCKDSFKTHRSRRRNGSTPRRSTTQEPDINHQPLLLPSPLTKSKSSTNTSYDKAIKNIDHLISRAISSSSASVPPPPGDDGPMIAPPLPSEAPRSSKVEPLSAAGVRSPSNELSSSETSQRGNNNDNNFEVDLNEISEDRRKAAVPTVHYGSRDLIMERRRVGQSGGGGRPRRRSASAGSERIRLVSSSSSDGDEWVNGNTPSAAQVVTAAGGGWSPGSGNRRGRDRKRRPATPLNRKREAKDGHNGTVEGKK